MENGFVMLPQDSLRNSLAGSVAEVEGLNFKRWPDEPSGAASGKERGKRVQLALAIGQPLPEIEVFEHINFGGASWRTNLNYLYVGDWWNDKISSIIIVRGTWRFYQHSNYGGAYWDLTGPAYYPWVEAANIPNDIISSFQCIAL